MSNKKNEEIKLLTNEIAKASEENKNKKLKELENKLYEKNKSVELARNQFNILNSHIASEKMRKKYQKYKRKYSELQQELAKLLIQIGSDNNNPDILKDLITSETLKILSTFIGKSMNLKYLGENKSIGRLPINSFVKLFNELYERKGELRGRISSLSTQKSLTTNEINRIVNVIASTPKRGT